MHGKTRKNGECGASLVGDEEVLIGGELLVRITKKHSRMAVFFGLVSCLVESPLLDSLQKLPLRFGFGVLGFLCVF